MLPKKGICIWRDLQQTMEGAAARPISYRLLRLPAENGEEAIRGFERIASGIRHTTGVCRTTCRGRLQDVDRWVAPHLIALASSRPTLEVHDWAVSDGLASSEWALQLFHAYPRCEFTASDLNPYLVEVTRPGRGAYVFEAGGAPLQYVRSPFVVSLDAAGRRGFLAKRLVHAWAGRARKLWAQLAPDGDEDGAAGLGHPARLPLIHPEALALQRQRPSFNVVRHSVFDELPTPVDVIRTMNILNRSYFGDAELAQGARAVFASLRPEGLWVLGRTTIETRPERNRVTLFSRTGKGFVPIDRLNGGSELEELIEERSRIWRS